MLSLMFSAGKKSDGEIVQDVMGNMLYMYYQYLDNYGRPPIDIEEMADGLCYFELKCWFEKKAMDEAGAMREHKK